MGVLRLRDLVVRKDLIYMRIHCHSLEVGRGHKSIPGRQRLEGVVNENECVRLLGRTEGEANVAVRIVPELTRDVEDFWIITRRSMEVALTSVEGQDLKWKPKTHSLSGAITDTTLGSEANMLAILLMIAFVRSMLDWLDCHCG